MKITINPMAAAIAAKTAQINAAFSRAAAEDLHRDLAHAQKVQWASSQKDQHRLQPEANLRGITTAELAELILSKAGDAIAEREFKRQQIMQRIEAAKTPGELDAI